MKRFLVVFLFIAGVYHPCCGQNTAQDKSVLDSLIKEKKFPEAALLLEKQLLFYNAMNSYDSLATFPYYIGIINHNTNGAVSAIKHIDDFITDLEAKGAGDRNMQKSYMSYVRYLDETGKVQHSYTMTEKALYHAEKMPDKTPEETGYIIYNLGASALSMGEFDLAGKHFRQALKQYEIYDNTPQSKLADAYNAMGAMMWLSTKLDSAALYYKKSVNSIEKSDTDSISKKYLSAVTLSNVALIQQNLGKSTEAIETLKKVLENYLEVEELSDNIEHINKAKVYKWNATSNLAVFYNDLGDFNRANKLLAYVLEDQARELDSTDSRVFKTRVKLGQSLMSLKRYREAQNIFIKALQGFEANPADEFYWKAITFFGLAETAEALGNKSEASNFYAQSERYFEKILKDGYDRQYLNFLVKQSSFLAETKEKQKAEQLALKGYNYTVKFAPNEGLVQFKQLLNLAEVNFKIGNIEKSVVKSNDALKLLETIQNSGSILDSVQLEYQKPKAVLIKTRSAHQLQQNRDSLFLKKLYEEMQKTISILERQKSITIAPENVSALLENNKELFDFIKELGLELYKLTGNKKYLEKTLGYHESGLYYKIRSRFNKRDQIASYGLPPEIIKKENELKENIHTTLSKRESAGLKSFFNATNEWNEFLNRLKIEFPRYYKMRYETISETAITVQNKLDKNTTLVRYVYIGEELHAFLITKNSISLFSLKSNGVNDLIKSLNRGRNLEEEYLTLNLLYNAIWHPFAETIKTKNVIVIPDANLFNLSFETLVEKQVKTSKDFVKHSLLSKHSISYNFSLLLHQEKNEKEYKTNFVAFAPGFVEEMKADYTNKEKTSPLEENLYLSMLPQPFTLDLIENLRKKYYGKTYIKQASTLTNFIKNGHNTKILHIGTHAESNNISPEFSRLLFAKDLLSTDEENFMYAHEIYNQNFSSHLAILTACETGKPNYQAGEGMISLAHAFHYAGSESLLTGIWRIDEQASAIIMESFYKYLSEGLTKPEALQKSKLDYLSNAKGRAQSPEYWAGIVLMGDPSPVMLKKNNKTALWGAGALIVLFGFYGLNKLQKNRSKVDEDKHLV